MPIPFLPDVRKIAIVGVSSNPQKWGHKIFFILKKRYPDLIIYPINPKIQEISGFKVYPSITELPEVPELVISVVKPQITEKIFEQACEIGVKYFWMQPGSESKEVINLAERKNIKIFYNTCILQSSAAGKIVPYES